MRKLQKPLVAEAKTSKKKPLAEGLQIEVPTDSQGRRLWSKMSDKQITEYARRVVGEKGIIGRTELSKADTGLYQVLRKKQLLDSVGFEERYRSWRDMEDEEIVELARKVMEEREISGRHELEKADSGLYTVLSERGLLEEVGFEDKQRPWREISDEEIVEYARKVMEEIEISGKAKLRDSDRRLYDILHKRGLFEKVGLEDKYRSWRDMEDEEIVELARKLMEERGISGKKELERSDTGLHSVLRARGLLDEVGFKQKRRNERSWKDMSDEEIVEYARKVIEENKIISRRKLRSTDGGLYFILYRRGLLDRAFARIDQQKTDQARDAVIDALEAFTVANDNAISEDDVA